jgi:hypothetical protein
MDEWVFAEPSCVKCKFSTIMLLKRHNGFACGIRDAAAGQSSLQLDVAGSSPVARSVKILLFRIESAWRPTVLRRLFHAVLCADRLIS